MSDQSGSSPLDPGTTFSRYRLVEEIGEGGTDVVRKAADVTLDGAVDRPAPPPARARRLRCRRGSAGTRLRGRVVRCMLAVALLSAAASADAPTLLYRVDPERSTAGFSLDSTWHMVRGSGARLEGEVRVNGEEGDVLRLAGEVRADARLLVTGNRRRDRKMHAETLAVKEHPYVRFVPEGIAGEHPTRLLDDGEEHPMLVSGVLEVRGVRRHVDVPVTVRLTAGRLVVDGTLDIPFLAHGVPDPSFFLARVEKVVHATFHLEASRGEGSP